MIHDLATDNAVVAVVATDPPHRPAAAAKAPADDTARRARPVSCTSSATL
ncbi:hypothetical protein ACFUIY_28500 [Streptomyces griseorubiginosus]|nr:hypothetical protein [Streptomyces griseorubiginosus]